MPRSTSNTKIITVYDPRIHRTERENVEIRTLNGFLKVLHTIIKNVEADKPVRLGSCLLLKSPFIYRCPDISKRTLMENMTLSLMDDSGNESGQDLNGRVLVSISTNNKESRQVPLFENNSDTIEMKLEAGKIFVARLAIKERSPGDNAVAYKVTFKPEVSTLSSTLESFELPFYYFQVEKSHPRLAELTANKNRLEEKMKETAKTIKKFRDLITLLTAKLETYKKEDQRFLTELNTNLRATQSSSSEDIANILSEKEAEKRIIENSPRRVCNIQGNIQNPDSHKDILGMLGHLAFIKEDDIARVISWHLRNDLNCIITRTAETAHNIYTLTAGRQSIMALDLIILPQRKRVLPHLRLSNEHFHLPGNPVFATDFLIFPSEKESCELVHDTVSVFRNLLGETIVMDDLDSAISYRKAVVRRKIPCPTILTRQGDRINASGKFGDLKNKAPPMDKLHVFGAPLPQCYYTIESQIDTLTRYHALKVNMEKTIKEYDTQLKNFNEEGRERSLQDTQVELDRITEEIEFELMRIRKRTGDCGELCETSIKKTKTSM